MGRQHGYDTSEGTERAAFTVARATLTSSDCGLAMTNEETGEGCVFIIPSPAWYVAGWADMERMSL